MTHRVLAATLVPALGAIVTLTPARPTAARPEPPPPPVVFSVNVAQVWDHKAFVPLREARGKAEFAWAVQGVLGVAPADIERLTVVARDPGGADVRLEVTTRKPVDPAAVARQLSPTGPQVEKEAAPGVYRLLGGELGFVQRVGERTLRYSPKSADPAVLAKATTPEANPGHTLAVRVPRAALAGLLGDVPPALKGVSSVSLTADLEGENRVVVEAGLKTDSVAATIPRVGELVKQLAAVADARAKQLAGKPQDNATAAPLLELLATAIRNAKVEPATDAVRVTAELDASELAGRLVAALPESALGGGAIGGNARALNNLKQIGIAWHAYHDANGNLPSNTYAKDGTPLLSWRVHILPYIEQSALYQQFKLDEPWDGPNNKKLLDTLVAVYTIPGRPAANPNETYFRSFIGPKNVKPEYRPMLLEGESKGPGIVSITDGTSNTFMVVEAGKSVPWTKPDDMPYDGVMPLPTLGGPGGQFLALFGDGSARIANRNRNPEATLRGYITIAGGEVLPPLR